MKKQNRVLSSLVALASVSALLTGCGSKVAGTYTLTEQGSFIQQNCQQVTLNVQDSGGTINGSGSNACGTHTLTGTTNNGIITVSSYVVMPSTGTTGAQNAYYGGVSSYGNTYGSNMSYTGTLTVSGNSISGSLMGSGGQLIVNGTKN